MRKLPTYGDEKYITCNYIRNTEARFCNRRRQKGWVTPTVEKSLIYQGLFRMQNKEEFYHII